VWLRLIRMDGVTRAAVMGMLCYPRSSWRISLSYLPNHKSWEVEEVKAKLGQKMAAYFVQVAMEFVFPGHPLPSIIEPKGAVPKKGADKYRDIADARKGNKSLSDWGVRYFTARELALALSWRAIVNGHDINDGYHIAVLAGCSGVLVWGWGIVETIYIFPGDPEFEPRTARFKRLLDLLARRSASSSAGACTSAAGLATAAKPATSPLQACSLTAASLIGPSPTSARSPPAALSTASPCACSGMLPCAARPLGNCAALPPARS
jgi:hypothetical protein